MSEHLIGPEDYRRALALLLHTNPPDLAGINVALTELAAAGRVTFGLLALCEIAHAVNPELRTESGREALRALVARLTLDSEGNTP